MTPHMKEYIEEWHKRDLLIYVANAYVFMLDYKLNNNETSKHMFSYMKSRIKTLTTLPIKDITEIIYSVDAFNEPIRHIYNQLVEWI